MRRASHPLLVIFAAIVAAGASAGAANVANQTAPQKPALRTGGGRTVLTTSKPALRASAATAPLVKAAPPSMRKIAVAPKPTVHKMVVRVTTRAKPMHTHIAVRTSPSIALPIDEVRVVAFSQPVSTIYVGNPMIADVSMIDSKHAFVLGKSFGATNIVALNGDGKQVVNDPVSVYGHSGNTVILHRGTAQATYACTGLRCEAAPMPGDDKDSFTNHMDQVASHQDAGVKAANASH
jgi:hypothetical protein